MIIDFVNKTVLFTFDEMKSVQSNLSEALRLLRTNPKESSTVNYCVRGAGHGLYMNDMERKEGD